jgi:hypothetical protein
MGWTEIEFEEEPILAGEMLAEPVQLLQDEPEYLLDGAVSDAVLESSEVRVSSVTMRSTQTVVASVPGVQARRSSPSPRSSAGPTQTSAPPPPPLGKAPQGSFATLDGKPAIQATTLAIPLPDHGQSVVVVQRLLEPGEAPTLTIRYRETR